MSLKLSDIEETFDLSPYLNREHSVDGKRELYFVTNDGYLYGSCGLNSMALYMILDSESNEIEHIIIGYSYQGSYCGDFELDPLTFDIAIKNRDFTGVIMKYTPNTILNFPFLDCNTMIDDGSDLKLPLCADSHVP